MSQCSSAAFFYLVETMSRVCFDYTPNWQRGNTGNYVDAATFPKVLTNKSYSYRVVVNGRDLGVRAANGVNSDGSQQVNLLDYSGGYGVDQGSRIQIYAADPDDSNQYPVAH